MIISQGLLTSVYFSFLILPNKKEISRITILVLIAQFLFLIESLKDWRETIVFVDGITKLSKELIISELIVYTIAIIGIIVISKFIKNQEAHLLQLTNLIGLIYMINSNDWLITITAWELFNISLYLLIASTGNNSESALSATIKYFLLSALTSGFFLLSVTLLYAKTGNTQYDSLKMLLSFNDSNFLIFLPILITFFFKLGAAPLHNWAPDVYDGIPSYLTLWLATISKIGVLLLLIQVSYILDNDLKNVVLLFGSFSLIIGSIGLGSQWKIKRFLAYSSISHIGFLLIAWIVSIDSYFYYLIIYSITSQLLFTILLSISLSHNIEITSINQLSGIFKQNQIQGVVIAFAFFSLAGIPPLAGFYAKLMVLKGIFHLGYYSLGIIAILTSAISAANYLSIIRTTNFDLPYYSIAITINSTLSYVISLLSTFLLLFSLNSAQFLSLITFIINLS